MTYDSIRQMATCVTPQMFSERPTAVHESCTRAYQILAKVKALLDAGTERTA